MRALSAAAALAPCTPIGCVRAGQTITLNSPGSKLSCRPLQHRGQTVGAAPARGECDGDDCAFETRDLPRSARADRFVRCGGTLKWYDAIDPTGATVIDVGINRVSRS
jgi:hypothetical protein